jgi:hypothetical protein
MSVATGIYVSSSKRIRIHHSPIQQQGSVSCDGQEKWRMMMTPDMETPISRTKLRADLDSIAEFEFEFGTSVLQYMV